MKKNVIYFVDEDEAARRANGRALATLLDNPSLKIMQLEPFASMADYNSLLADSTTGAFVLDQRMKGSGKVTYNGTDLARHLRGIDSKIPIYILTGHADETADFEGSNHLVEYIIGKDQIETANSEEARTIKARILRHLEVFSDVRDAQEQRFHDLLLKSLDQALTLEEQREMTDLEGETSAAVLAAERPVEQAIGKKMEELSRLLDGGHLAI